MSSVSVTYFNQGYICSMFEQKKTFQIVVLISSILPSVLSNTQYESPSEKVIQKEIRRRSWLLMEPKLDAGGVWMEKLIITEWIQWDLIFTQRKFFTTFYLETIFCFWAYWRRWLNLFVAFTLRNLSWPVTVGQAFGSFGRKSVDAVLNEAGTTLNGEKVAGVVEELQRGY